MKSIPNFPSDSGLAEIPIYLTVIFNCVTVAIDIIFVFVLHKTSTRLPKPNQTLLLDVTNPSSSNNNLHENINDNNTNVQSLLHNENKKHNKGKCNFISSCPRRFITWLTKPKYPIYFFQQLTDEKKRDIAKQYLTEPTTKDNILKNPLHRLGKIFTKTIKLDQHNKVWITICGLLRFWNLISGIISFALVITFVINIIIEYTIACVTNTSNASYLGFLALFFVYHCGSFLMNRSYQSSSLLYWNTCH